MNAEQIIAHAVEDVLADHKLVWQQKRCSCGRWRVGPKEKLYGTMELLHDRHRSEEVARKLVDRTTWRIGEQHADSDLCAVR